MILQLHAGNTAPYRITQPSTDNDVQIVSPTATMISITCSLNITIPFSTIVIWSHNGNIATIASNRNAIKTSHSTTLLIENPQSSDAGVYQCMFNGIANDGWVLRRNVRLFITGMSLYHKVIIIPYYHIFTFDENILTRIDLSHKFYVTRNLKYQKRTCHV